MCSCVCVCVVSYPADTHMQWARQIDSYRVISFLANLSVCQPSCHPYKQSTHPSLCSSRQLSSKLSIQPVTHVVRDTGRHFGRHPHTKKLWNTEGRGRDESGKTPIEFNVELHKSFSQSNRRERNMECGTTEEVRTDRAWWKGTTVYGGWNERVSVDRNDM